MRKGSIMRFASLPSSMIQKAALVLCLTLLLTPLALAEVINYDDSWGGQGFNLISQDNNGVEIVFSITRLNIEDMNVNGENMQMVSLPGVILPNDEGAPNLPGTGRFIAVPEGGYANVQIIAERVEIFHDMNIVPAPPIPLGTDDSPPVYKKDPAIYNVDAYYPESPVMISEVTQMRGVDVVIVGVTPFQYNPVTKELVVYRDLRVKVDFIGGGGHFGEDPLRSRYWEPILQGNLLNYASLPQVNLNRVRQSDEEDLEYIIIVPDDPVFMAWADTLKEWRNKQGIITGVVPLSEIGGNNATLIENYINNAYHSWAIRPVAVLLLSDYQNTGDLYGITSPLYSGTCSDNIYADVDGNNLPDIAIARITAQNGNHLATMIQKMLTYEREPYTTANFHDNPLIAGGWQSDRWFILCCEVIYGYMENVLGKRPVRQYAGASGPPSSWSSNQNTWMIIDYFGPNGLGYIPQTPSHLTNWSGNAAGINSAINSGAFIVQHRDHGSEDGWADPSYHNGDLSGLSNDMYTFVFSINCLTGKYNWSNECFTEAFHRMEHGALGVIAASGVSYSFVNDTYVWGMYDSMWPNFDPGYGVDTTGLNDLRPGLANVYGKYYLEASSWPYNTGNKVITYHLFHMHGDAFTTLYSEVPQNLTVSHMPVLLAGLSEFTVTANEGALIALTVNSEIIGVGMGTGAPVTIDIIPQLPPSNVLVTATLANYFRYEAEVPVVPPSGAYVVYNSVEINDASGNNNGMLDFGEDVLLSVTVENVGSDEAQGVDVFIDTDDTYTTIIDGEESYGNIAANSTAVVTDAFEIAVAQDVPDNHNIAFTLTATDGDSIWTSNFTITAHAPVIEFEELVIDDATGNQNNQLDPGETADFQVMIKNNGSCDAANVQVVISTTEPLITIPNPMGNVLALAAGAEAAIIYEDIIADSTMFNGTEVEFAMDITADGGYVNSDGFDILVGDERYAPSGPDSYGYWAYDSYDGLGAPVYEWIEINPQAGGPGTIITLGDDVTGHVNLPFMFRYYGNDFSELSICSNGWVALGYQTTTDWSNSGIPNSDGPSNMVAPFWDDLNPNVGGVVVHYYDEENHRFIVEYYQVPHYGSGGGPETFQVILYDPAYLATMTGDGEIVYNYHTIANASSITVGIENGAQTVGLQFLYNGSYDVHAMPLENEFSIRFTTGEMPQTGDLEITLEPEALPIVIPAAGGTFDYDLTIENIGIETAYFQGWIDVTLPAGTTYGPLLIRSGLSLAPGASIFRSMTQTVPASAPAGNYTYWGHVGANPTAWSEDSFPFEKTAVDNSASSPYQTWSLTGWGDDAVSLETPSEYFLTQNYPNPFNPETTIEFGLKENSKVTLEVYNVMGQRVATLIDGYLDAGYQMVVWDASSQSSGVYFYKLHAGDFTSVKKCIIMK